MNPASVEVEILESTPRFVKLKLPAVNIPVEMSHDFFKIRLDNGYFKVRQSQ